MKERLSKALAHAGIASRRECEEIIFSGRVQVNGKTVLVPQTLVDFDIDTIHVDKKEVKGAEKKVYFLLNKPPGYICTSSERKYGAKRVVDLFSHLPYRMYTVGRLDLETAGLIIVTNDGHLANRVMHPSYNVTKEYLAKTSQEITFDHIKKISEGLIIDRVHVKPLSVKKVRRGTLKITVGEGKKHEVRELLKGAGLTIIELIRIRIGPITLSNLAEGQYREMSDKEIAPFLMNA